MLVRRVDPSDIDAAVISEAAAVITHGGLVAFPTETVYGLGADATNPLAVARIFEAKGRPAYNPLIVHAASAADAARCVATWPQAAQVLADRFWPGPLTLVLPKAQSITPAVTAGLTTVGVRVPDHPVARALIQAAGVPIAAPSANRSMHISPTIGAHVAASLGDAPDLILDAGPARVGIESTVLDLSAATPTVLRPGMISVEELRAVLGDVAVASAQARDGEARASPGMMERHYSPAAAVRIVAPGADSVSAAALEEERRGNRVVALARSPVAEDSFAVWQMPEGPAEYARVLYGQLHRADAEGYQVIVVEAVPGDAAWDGVRDRLTRAAR